MQQATFRIEDYGPYARATADGRVAIELWCNDHCDLLLVSRPDTGAERGDALSAIDGTVGIRDERIDGDTHVVITDDCLQNHDDTIETYLVDHGCLLLPPLTYRDGAKHCRILAIDAAALTAIYRDLAADHAVDVVEKHDLASPTPSRPRRSLDALLPRLTDRQRTVFVAAHDAGYYRIPRDVTTSELAADFDLDRRTLEDHLRRAENKLVDALVDSGAI